MNPVYDVFLSYSRSDELAVTELAEKLRKAGKEPFIDKGSLSPGQPWQPELEEGLRNSKAVAVFIGAQGPAPWQREETRVALSRAVDDSRFPVIPVLLPGARKPDKSEFLASRTWVEFTTLNDDGAFQSLIHGIERKADEAGPGRRSPYRCMAQPPEEFVHRREYDEALEALCPRERSQDANGIVAALWGAGGFGKSALARKICWDERIHEAYPDGVLWTTMGEDVDGHGRLSRTRDLIRWWTRGETPAFEDVDTAGAALRETLARSRILVVIDDVWNPADITPFKGIGEGSALLITTRDTQTLPAGLELIELRAMASPEAASLLRSGLPAGEPLDVELLAARLGEWPLLLKLVNRQLRELVDQEGQSLSQALREVGEALSAEGIEAFDLDDRESRNAAASRTLLVSIRRLSEQDQKIYLQLAIFSQDLKIPLPVLERFWNLPSFSVKKLCGRLYNLSLLLDFDRMEGNIRLHGVFRRILEELVRQELPALHDRLLSSCQPPSGRWADLPQQEKYLWQNLASHFKGAQRTSQLRDLLLDFSFAEAKLTATDVQSLIADYSALAVDKPELRMVEGALRLATHVLIENKAQLAPQLIGRLLDRKEEGLRRLIEGAQAWRGRSLWFRPRTASLTRPEGPLIRTLQGHRGGVWSVAVLEGQRAVSCSSDQTLRIWDLRTGRTLRILKGHEARINAVVIVERRAISGAKDAMLRVWDLQTGETLRLLEGHGATVSTVAAIDGRRAVSGSKDKTLKVWDLETGKPLQSFKRHKGTITALAVADGPRVVSGSEDGALWLWDPETGQDLRLLEQRTAPVLAIAAIDGRRVLSASEDRTVRILDLDTGQGRDLGTQASQVTALRAIDGDHALFGTEEGTVEVWDLAAGKPLKVFSGHTSAITTLALVDERQALSGSADGTLRLWNLAAGQPTQPKERAASEITLAGMLDEGHAVTSQGDGTTRIWDLETGAALRSLEGRWGALAALIDGRWAISTLLEICDLETGEKRLLQPQEERVSRCRILDRRRAVVLTGEGYLRLQDLESGEVLRQLEGPSAPITALTVTETGWVVSGTKDGRRQVWDPETGLLHTFKGKMPRVTAIAGVDTTRVISSAPNGKLFLWDVVTGQVLRTLVGPPAWVAALEVIEGRRLLSASNDCRLTLWDIEEGRVLGSLTLDSPVKKVAVARDGSRVVAGDSEGRVHFLDVIEPDLG